VAQPHNQEGLLRTPAVASVHQPQSLSEIFTEFVTGPVERAGARLASRSRLLWPHVTKQVQHLRVFLSQRWPLLRGYQTRALTVAAVLFVVGVIAVLGARARFLASRAPGATTEQATIASTLRTTHDKRTARPYAMPIDVPLLSGAPSAAGAASRRPQQAPAALVAAVLRVAQPTPPPPNVKPAALRATPAEPIGGSLLVETEPSGAQVIINLKPVGVTPLLLSNIVPGAYAVQVKVDGYSHWSRGIYIKLNQQTHVVAQLERER
jgi:hypothetical protein